MAGRNGDSNWEMSVQPGNPGRQRRRSVMSVTMAMAANSPELWRHGVRWRYGYAVLGSSIVLLLSVLPPSSIPLGDELPHLDKLGHGVAYFVLGNAYLNVSTEGWSRITPLRALLGLGALMLYALSDEWHQTFVPGRSFEWADLAADGLGGLLAVGIAGRLGRVADAAGRA